MSVSIGDTVGDYRILEELGRGGMGRVYKVEHTVTRRGEAMKILAGGRPDASPEGGRSLREIQLQASLDHPHIAAVHNAFWAGEDLVLVMELIHGRSLRRELEAGRVPLAATLDYAAQALSALSYAHSHGVIHRDISPGNMMIGPTGVLKLTDFGLATGPAYARLSQSGAPLGSLWYMSPEQVRGSKSDARSDIYSLGAVLYELTSGRKPFDGESAFAIMADQVGKAPQPLHELDPSLPEGLSAVILRALEKDPDQRFQSAEEFREALANTQNLATPPVVFRSRTRWAAAALVCLGLAMAALYVASGWLPTPAHETAALQSPGDVPREIEPVAAPEPAKKAARKPAKSGPNIFRKALKPIWPLKHEKPAPAR